jgi:SWI/SNF related-matrix-associated actin-dependent regulator of chromatin subfamily C
MDDDSLSFGSPAAVATPNSNSILAQPPLQPEAGTPSAQDSTTAQDEGASTNGKYST